MSFIRTMCLSFLFSIALLSSVHSALQEEVEGKIVQCFQNFKISITQEKATEFIQQVKSLTVHKLPTLSEQAQQKLNGWKPLKIFESAWYPATGRLEVVQEACRKCFPSAHPLFQLPKPEQDSFCTSIVCQLMTIDRDCGPHVIPGLSYKF